MHKQLTASLLSLSQIVSVLFAVLLMSGCASVARPAAALSNPNMPPYDAWKRVLNKHVDDEGRVNFAALANDRADLDRFVAYIYDVGPNNHPSVFPSAQDVLAFHINAYNALAMHKVIETGIPQSLAGLRKVTFFAFGKVQVGGEKISLYDYENKVIRALGDPRIHVALNCMSISCPRLPKDVFLAATLDQQLDRESVKFFAEPRNVMIDSSSKTITLSEILKFYNSDFLAKSKSLAAYVNLYRTDKVPEDYAVKFFDYDWTINRQPGN